MHDELLTLRNLGKTSSQWLHASGIHTAADLRRLGAVGSYRAVKARGFGASRVLLYAIEGALCDLPWQELPASLKDELNRLLDESHNKS
ncbi:competence protein TfoX [Pseudomonas sp. JL972]|uniref:TfoX/Sxy family protein n=1 Tax=Stutzerimonas degradans TaxID=2968968 RepID=UPI0012D91C4B|nr:TfoX/Sxy family protein [Stutzerimonas degradans]MTZ15554.1 competence protein TfoX [Stutzerimonas degradans]